MPSRMGIYRARQISQSGAGLGGLLASLFRAVVPIAKTVARKGVGVAVKAARSHVGKQAIKSIKKSGKKALMNAAKRAVAGEDIKEGAKADLKRARADLSRALEANEELRVKKRRRPVKLGRGALI